MSDQAKHWSKAAEHYDDDFIDPYRADVRNPLLPALDELAAGGAQVVADLGCGTGPLLPHLVEHFPTVYAVDFAAGMLRKARERVPAGAGVQFLQRPLTDLAPLAGKLDAAVAVNSLVMPDVRDLEKVLAEIRQALKPGGQFLAILPAIDAVHYYTMLLVDRALDAGLPTGAARRSAGQHCEHHLYDFAFGQFRFKGLEQHFWQPFEVRHRLKRAGFRRCRTSQVLLSWEQFAFAAELKKYPPPWDWFARAEVPA